MYDPQTGVYITSEESFPNQGLYQKDSAYYLKFNSSKGLYAIKQLKAQYEGIESNRCFYYHVYLDLLFEYKCQDKYAQKFSYKYVQFILLSILSRFLGKGAEADKIFLLL